MSGQRGNIVVGVDGSAASRAALRWAVDRAVSDGGTVTAVEVTPPTRLAPGTSYAFAPYGTVLPVPRVISPLHEIVTAVQGSVPDAPPITELRVRGEAVAELVRAAEHSELLVLGHTSHNRTTELLFGRVVAECVRRARCPVVLVPTSPGALG